jgi:hypothetical protein
MACNLLNGINKKSIIIITIIIIILFLIFYISKKENLTNVSLENKSWKYVGCYKDSDAKIKNSKSYKESIQKRALPILRNSNLKSWSDCLYLGNIHGDEVVGIAANKCWAGSLSDYNKYGKSDESCPDGGSSNKNQVFVYTSNSSIASPIQSSSAPLSVPALTATQMPTATITPISTPLTPSIIPTPTPTLKQDWVSKGCFMDSQINEDRVIPAYNGQQWVEYYNDPDTINKCKNLAISRGHNLIGIQNGGACFTSDKSVNYNKYGPVKSGFTCDMNGNPSGSGGPWTNNIYVYEDPSNPSSVPSMMVLPPTSTPPPPPPPTSTSASASADQWIDKGCYNDTHDRALKNMRGLYTIDECKNAAIQNSDDVIGLQYGNGVGNGKGQCWTDKTTTSNYAKYGPLDSSKTCELYGSDWNNRVFIKQ